MIRDLLHATAHCARKFVAVLRGRRSLLAALALASVVPALAHPMPMSGVLLDFSADHIDAELRLPTDRLEIGFGLPVAVPVPGMTFPHEAALRTYLAAHVTPHAPDGRAWQVEIGDIRFIADVQPVLVAHLRLTPPGGAPTRQLAFDYDVIAHEIVTHTVVVAVRRDWPGGKTSVEPETLGIIRNEVKSVAIDRGAGSAWRGFGAMAAFGATHIAEGTDHLLFLLALLLPAPLLVRPGRWSGATTVAAALRRVGLIVTAFSLGHSCTLLAGTLGWLRLPSQPVETVIALSVLVSAVHAIRPVFAGREAWVAGAFGLVHGLAFATTLAGLDLTAGQLAWSLAGFNLGIEAVQLAVIAATVPWLVLLARGRFYSPLRIVGALFAAVAALGWMAERWLNAANPFAPPVEWLARHALWLLACLAALAATQVCCSRRALSRSQTIKTSL